MEGLRDPFADSELVKQTARTGEVNIFDVDGTLTTRKESSNKGLAAQGNVLQLAKLRGAVCILTARRQSMLMSAATYAASQKMGFYECPPRFGFGKDGLRIFVPPEHIPELIHLTDAPLAIGALGEGIAVLNGKGYRVDREYHYILALGTQGWKESNETTVWESWRNGVIPILRKADRDGDILRAFAAIEFSHNYYRGETDVPGPDNRIELRWDEEYFGKYAFCTKLQVVARLRGRYAPLLRPYRVKIIDESRPKRRSQIYLTPEEGCKLGMINRIVGKICEHSGIDPDELTANFFGDMPPDLEAGLMGMGVKNFCLAGASPLAKTLLGGRKFFAGESLQWVYDRLRPTATEGVFDVVSATSASRRFLILDALFPGLPGPQSIEAFYNSKWASRL